MLMGIHKSLRHLFRNPSRGYEWLRKPNQAFGGASAWTGYWQGPSRTWRRAGLS